MNNPDRVQEILILCGLGAVARYLFSDGPFSPRALLANVVLASFLGWCAVLIAEWKNWPSGMVGPIAGALCWLGPTAVTTFAKRLLKAYTEGPK